jgi:hypothetical protein
MKSSKYVGSILPTYLTERGNIYQSMILFTGSEIYCILESNGFHY